MQIVIDISEEDYKNLKRKDKFDDMFLNYYEKLIVLGTPLPKGHGRLIDADAKNKELTDDYHGMISDESMKIYKIIQMLDDAPTIIDADKESN